MIIFKRKIQAGRSYSQNHLADEQSELRYRFFQYCTQMEHFIDCPNSWFFIPFSSGESLTHWRRTREGAPIECSCRSGSCFGVSVWYLVVHLSCTGESPVELRKPGKEEALIFSCNWYGHTSWEVLNGGWEGWVHMCTRALTQWCIILVL